MPAEGLAGFDGALKAIASKVDAIGAKDDPAALQQLEAAMEVLRSMISRVASDEALTKVAEDVRTLSAKVDHVAGGGSNVPTLAALENRIDILASALNASTEAGHAVPRELEKLLSGLVEKLEWVQLTHTDRTALGHLEDRIAALVKRLDASDSRLGLLEGVERGLADLLVYIEQLRGANNAGAAIPAAQPSLAATPVERADTPSNKRNDPNKRIDSDRRSNLASFRCMTICSKNRKERPILLQSTAPASRLSTQASGRMRRSHRRRRCRRKVLRPCRSHCSGDTKSICKRTWHRQMRLPPNRRYGPAK
jgi:hypothetical protein